MHHLDKSLRRIVVRAILPTATVALIALSAPAQNTDVDRADSLSSLFEYEAAIDIFHNATSGTQFRRLSGLSYAENMYGLDLLAAGDRDSAEAHFERAIDAAEKLADLYPDSAATYFNLAGAYGNLALLKGAKTKVKIGRDVELYGLRAIEIDSTYSDALAVLGVFYREVARLNWFERLVAKTLFGGLPKASLEKSESYLRRAVESDPESAWATYELGQTLIAMKRYDEAQSVLERLIELEPRNGQDVRNIAEATIWLEEHARD